MTKPGNKSKPTPADRLHAILGGMKNEESPINRLPKAKLMEERLAPEVAPVQPSLQAAPRRNPLNAAFKSCQLFGQLPASFRWV